MASTRSVLAYTEPDVRAGSNRARTGFAFYRPGRTSAKDEPSPTWVPVRREESPPIIHDLW